MKTSASNGTSLLTIGAILLITAFVTVAARPDDPKAKAQAGNPQNERLIESLKGPDLFRAHCSPCHGADGKGGGPVASVLNSAVPDLTKIQKRNGGIFPEQRVRKVILGDDVMVAHGSREMPIWGPIFHQVEQDRDYGNVRVKNLIEYLKSIQEK
jgi:mono/diheme cytochrome c family protein